MGVPMNFHGVSKCSKNDSHVLINALSEQSHLNKHIPGSICIPISEYMGILNNSQINNIETLIQENITPNIFAQLNKKHNTQIYDVPIIAYCANTSCRKSEQLIDILLKLGFLNVSDYPGGIKEWILKGGPVEKGRCNKKILYGGDDSVKNKQIKNKSNELVEENEETDENEEKEEKEENEEKEEEEQKDEEEKEEEEEEEEDVNKKTKNQNDKKSLPKITKKKKVRSEYDLNGQFEKIVFEDIIYIHNIENNEVYDETNKLIGVLKNDKIKWDSEEDHKQHILSRNKFNEEYNKEDIISSSSSEDDSSEEDTILEEVKHMKKEVNNLKYKKHKESLKCMNDIVPKIYNEKFRGWGFTFWGN